MNLEEKDIPKFKKWLKSHLNYGPVTVTFTKKDGTERVMLCTTNEDLIPKVIHESNTNNPVNLPKEKTARKVNEDVLPVYDLEAKAWKSFRWDSIKTITLTIGDD